MQFIKNQEWRYATKKFNSLKKISSENLNILKRAIQLSVSSYGLQLYKVLIIENPKIREELKTVSWGQNQITDASHLFVFCNYQEIKPEYIDDYINLTADTRSIQIDKMEGYATFMKNKLAEKSVAESTNWLERQPYIALANLLAACAELKIDACPMEGFEPEEYNRILKLNEQGLNACVIATLGYRSVDDDSQHLSKIRKNQELLFETV